MRPFALATLPALALALGCSGLLGGADPEALASLMGRAEPEDAVRLFLFAGSELGGLGSSCATCLQASAGVDASDRATIGARTLMDPSCGCPTTCASTVLPSVVELEPRERMAKVAEACDASGPDPVFPADRSALREASSPIDYALVRMVLEHVDDPTLTKTAAPVLSVGLALSGAHLEPTPEPVGSDALHVEASEALRACNEDVAHRLVVSPEGRIEGVATELPSECVMEVLAGLTLPEGGWRVVDLTSVASALPSAEPEPVRPTSRGAKPTAEPRPPVVVPTGSAYQSAIQQVMRRNANQVRSCYEDALRSDPTLTGRVTLDFTIDATGSVSAASSSGDLEGPVATCIVQKAWRFRFPAPGDGKPVQVRYPFVFQPG
ncbi:MAG: AgmX/PglI C-terminal domain-containing protein [Myxococcota bacterium]